MSKNVKITLGVVVGVILVVGILFSQGQFNTGSFKNLFMGKGGKGFPLSGPGGGSPASPPFTGPAGGCIAPYHVSTPSGNCVWSCGAGTRPNGVSNTCVCNAGVAFTGYDRFNRQVCGVPPFSGPFTGPVNRCTSPYHIRVADGRCVWSCGQGTRPNGVSNSCVCNGGLVRTGVDNLGRLTCGVPASQPFTGPLNACVAPYHARTADGRCVWSCGAGTRPDAASNTCVCRWPNAAGGGQDNYGRTICAQ